MIQSKSTIIQLQQATVAYSIMDQVHTVFRSLDLSIYEGQWTIIIGRNGTGKSTLAKALARLSPMSAGQLISRESIRVQLVMQDPDSQIVGETLLEDICFGLEYKGIAPERIPALAQEVLERVGLCLPLDHPTTELSGGQKQLLAIASILALQPDVIVFDEATAMLDPEARQRVLSVVSSLREQGTTIVWITQLLEEVTWADRIIGLVDNGIGYDGDARSFFYTNDLLEEDSACERLGFQPPYVIQVAKRLHAQGHRLIPYPLTISELREAVMALCR